MKESKKALIIIDMQNGFLEDKSPLCIKYAKSTIPQCARVIKKARAVGMPVIFVNRIYREDGSDVELTRKAIWEKGGKPLTLTSIDELSVDNPVEFDRQDSDYEIIKQRFSGFFQTELDMLLRRLGVKEIYLMGTTTPNCIRTTCYDGISLDYHVVVIEDCCSSNSLEIQKANIIDMRNIGADIICSDDFVNNIRFDNDIQL